MACWHKWFQAYSVSPHDCIWFPQLLVLDAAAFILHTTCCWKPSQACGCAYVDIYKYLYVFICMPAHWFFLLPTCNHLKQKNSLAIRVSKWSQDWWKLFLWFRGRCLSGGRERRDKLGLRMHPSRSRPSDRLLHQASLPDVTFSCEPVGRHLHPWLPQPVIQWPHIPTCMRLWGGTPCKP